MHDQVERRRHLLPDGPHGQVEARHQGQRLETGEGVTRAVGVDGRDRAVVARVHRLEHVQRLARTALTDDDAVGAHAEAVLDEVADGDLAAALDVGRAGLEGEHVVLVELELLGVLHRDDALVGRDERRQHVERRRLTGTGTAGDDDVEPADDAGLEEPGGVGVERAEADQVVDLERVLGELPDGEERPVDGERVDDRVHAGAVGEAGVDHGVGLVDATADLAHDLVDDAPQVGLVDEGRVGPLEPAGALHVHVVGPVHHDLGDVLVLQQPVDRPVAEDVVGDVLDELGLVGRRQRRPLLGERRVELLVDAPAEVLLGEPLVVEDRARARRSGGGGSGAAARRAPGRGAWGRRPSRAPAGRRAVACRATSGLPPRRVSSWPGPRGRCRRAARAPG